MIQETDLFSSKALVIALLFWCLPFSTTLAQAPNNARLNYILQCQGCHRADGSGTQPSTPSFIVDAQKFLKTKEGREYFISVPGSANSPLSDQELTQVANYIIENLIIKEGSGESLLYTVAEVSAYRKIKMLDGAAKRRQEILAHFD